MTRQWIVLLVASVATLVAAETLLLALGTGLLTSGYNTPRLDASTLWLAFLPGSALLDLWLVLTIWTVAIPLARTLSTSRLQVFATSGVAALGLPLAFATASYNLHVMLGSMFSVALASQASTLGAPDLVAEALIHAPHATVFVGFALMGAVSVWHLAGRWSCAGGIWRPQIDAEPRGRTLARATLAVTLACCFLIAVTSGHEGLRFGFDHKASGQLLGSLVDRLTDVDRDGFGSLRHPVDASPFDATRYPYALDIPDNGIDENGIGGDLPDAFVEPVPEDLLPVGSAPRPHVLLVYLESFRADLLDRRVAGAAVTPFLDRLAREGGASRHAHVHAPWTLESRAQMFGGRLVNHAGQSTLVDDFQARGYTVAHFSGQDDSYGNSVEVLGADRADVFYDARDDVVRRTSRSVAPVSLQVSWKTLLERVGAFLDDYDESTPLFLYVNVVDTHYPYTHDQVDPILDVDLVDRGGIRADSAREVFETYANTAANVDRAVERLVERFRAAIGGGDHAILVTADHGQAFYEHGALGHGQHLEIEETRVPFIVWGIGGEWPEPIAPTDVRVLLRRNLSLERDALPRPRFRPDPALRVFQYASNLLTPRYLAYRGTADTLRYDFTRDRWERLDPDGRPFNATPDVAALPDVAAPPADLRHHLLWRWEATQHLVALPQPAPEQQEQLADTR